MYTVRLAEHCYQFAGRGDNGCRQSGPSSIEPVQVLAILLVANRYRSAVLVAAFDITA